MTQNQGRLELLTNGSQTRAYYMEWFEPDAWFGVPTHWVSTDAQQTDLSAQRWCLEMAIKHARVGGHPDAQHIEWHAPSWSPETLRALDEPDAVFGIDSIEVIGRVALARARLFPPRTPWPDGLGISELDESQVDAVIDLWCEVFGSEPEWCWFGAQPGFLRQHRAGLAQPSDNGHRLVLSTEGRVVGYAAWNSVERPGWGRCAGMEILLALELRGRGLARHLYRRMLDEMYAAGVEYFSGGTCQLPVLHLGKEMGRQALLIHLHRGAGRRSSYFRPYLDAFE